MSRAASLPGAELFLKNPTFFGRSHLSQAASLPGAEPENRFFYKKQLVLASFAAWGITFGRKSIVFEEATCPGQLRCLGQMFFPGDLLFLKKPLVPGSFAARGRCFTENLFVLKKPLVPGSFAAWGRTFSRKSTRSHVPRAASLPGAELLAEN